MGYNQGGGNGGGNRSDYVGAAWAKESKDGKKFLSLVIDLPDGSKMNCVMFKNTRKERDNQPDYNILRSNDRQGDNSGGGNRQGGNNGGAPRQGGNNSGGNRGGNQGDGLPF